MSGKTCSKCGVEKSLTEFYSAKKGTDRVTSECKKCHAQMGRDWRARNVQSMRQYHREWHLAKSYGVTTAWYETTLVAQGGGCATCSATQPGHGKRHFCIDHDHETGELRGLLCYDCNLALGKLQDSVQTLENMVRYLGFHRAAKLHAA